MPTYLSSIQSSGLQHLGNYFGAIQQHIENPLSRGIIAGEYAEGDTVQVDADKDGLVFSKTAVPQYEAA